MSRQYSFSRRVALALAGIAVLLLGGCVVYDPYPYYAPPVAVPPSVSFDFHGGYRPGHGYYPYRYGYPYYPHRHYWR